MKDPWRQLVTRWHSSTAPFQTAKFVVWFHAIACLSFFVDAKKSERRVCLFFQKLQSSWVVSSFVLQKLKKFSTEKLSSCTSKMFFSKFIAHQIFYKAFIVLFTKKQNTNHWLIRAFWFSFDSEVSSSGCPGFLVSSTEFEVLTVSKGFGAWRSCRLWIFENSLISLLFRIMKVEENWIKQIKTIKNTRVNFIFSVDFQKYWKVLRI